jgi:hypothetical protein
MEESTALPNTESEDSKPYLHILFLEDNFNIILVSIPSSSKRKTQN